MVLTPGKMDVFRVRAAAQELRVPILKFRIQLAERGDLGGAYEGEVLRPEEKHLPLTRKVLVGDCFERVVPIRADGCGNVKLWKFIAYYKQACSTITHYVSLT